MNLNKIKNLINDQVDELIVHIESQDDEIDELHQTIKDLENTIEEKDNEIQRLKVEMQVFTFLENVK